MSIRRTASNLPIKKQRLRSIEDSTSSQTLCKTFFGFLFGVLFIYSLPLHAEPSKIYVIVQPQQSIAEHENLLRAVQSKFVGGVFLRATWEQVEPFENQYDWSYLDKQIAEAARLGKTVSVGIAAGAFTPRWVYSSGAAAFHTVYQLRRLKNFCQPAQTPVPWDKVFLRHWIAMVRAFGDRYSSNRAINLIKLGGINFQTWETILPHNNPSDPAKLPVNGCDIPDDEYSWRVVGYTPQRMSAAFKAILTAYATAFPTKLVAIMTGAKTFPAIGRFGQTDAAASIQSTTDFFAIGRLVLNDRFVGQDNALSAEYASPAIKALSKTNATGFQTEWPTTGDPTCFMNNGKHPCHPDQVFKEALVKAVKAGACYIEIFPKDVLNQRFSRSLEYALENLRACRGDGHLDKR